MPTRKDNTNVAPIHREQVFIPFKGAKKIMWDSLPKINGRRIASGAIDIVSPEFDLLTGIRGLANMVKPKTYKSIINNGDYNPIISEIDNAVNQGIQMGRDYINNPIVQSTLEHNRQLYKRLFGKPQNMIYINKHGEKVLAKERGELLNNAVSKPINYKFDKLPKGEAGTYNRNADMIGNITIAEDLTPTITKNSAFHETLHHGAYGNYDGIIYDLKAEKLFPNNSYLRAGHEAAANTAEVGRDMGLTIGQKYPGMNVFKNMLDNLPKPYYKDVVIKSAKLETPRDYKRFWDALTGKYFTTAGAAATGLTLTNNDKMKCGGRRKAQLGLDIQYGGRAIPISKNMVYFDGNSHENGGIGVGNKLEVEGGEVGEYKDNTLRVFSSVPFLRGVSPAQLVMGGANPNKVFKAQEDFKDRNRINDDGTRYEMGGAKTNNKIYDASGINKRKKIAQDVLQLLPFSGFVNDVLGFTNPINGGSAVKSAMGYGMAKAGLPFLSIPGIAYNGVLGLPDLIQDVQTLYKDIKTPKEEFNRKKKEFGGSMLYTINGNVKNGLMSARPKAQYGLATKYLKKRNKTAEKSVEIKQNDEPKVLDIRNTAGYKVKQFAENPWVKYPVEIASYLLTGATAKGMQTGTKMAKKAINKIDDILGKPRQEYLSRNVSDKTIKVGTIENPIRPKDSSRITKVYKPTINEISQAKQAAKPKTEPRIKSIDKIYKQVVGSKEPRSTVGNVPQWTEISYNPTNRTITAYDASVEFHKRISDILYDGLVKKYGKKGIDKAMKLEHISKYKYGGRIKAKAGKFLKYKNGVFTDPDSGEEYDVDPEVFKMRGNSFESGIIPVDENYTTSNYYYGSTFDNARPQFYAEKRLPLFGSQSLAEKFGLVRSGWSYADSPTLDYVPNINISVPINYAKAVSDNSKKSTSSTPRGRVTNTSNSTTSTKPATVEYPSIVRRDEYYSSNEPKGNSTPIDESYAARQSRGIQAINEQSNPSTGGETQSKDGNWVPQYNLITGRNLLDVGTNLAGHMVSYFANRDILDRYPMPTKPVMAPAAKLKTRVNINPELANSKEAELMGIEATNRNTSSSNTALARNQRIMNESRDARNKLYSYKENAETQLINQDKLNRQGIYAKNVAAYNDWLNKTFVAKTNKLLSKQQILMNLINGIPMAVNNVLGNIETRKSTNDMIRAIAASKPNVDGRLLGIGDYYTQQLANGKVAKYNKNHKFIKYV